MKNMKNKINIAACVMVAGLGLSSCSMDLLPLNEVVLENYWTEGEDVQSVVNSCYNAMQAEGFIKDIIVWGECRSDNTAANSSSADKNLRDLMDGIMKTTNPWCDWGPMYSLINRCNTVLHYAGEVKEKDPNYTESEYNISVAEVKFMRAYTYLTLIKTFKDVPFTLEASIDDTQDYRIGQTAFETILDELIEDIESCKNFPPIKYSVSIDNTARISRLAMYSLLAELYLWRASNAAADISSQQADYRSCIACCDYVLNAKINQYKEHTYLNKNEQEVNLESSCDRAHVYAYYGIPLLKETGNGATSYPLAFNEIFIEGNSFESIFEITFRTGEDINYAVSMYGGYADKDATSTVQILYADENLISRTPDNNSTYDNTKLFGVTSDWRSIEAFYYTEGSGAQSIYKYALLGINMAGMSDSYGKVSKTIYTKPTVDQTGSVMYSKDLQNPNWIIYRLSEIVLFRAEAEIALAGTMTGNADDSPAVATELPTGYRNGADLGTSEELYADAFNLIKAVYWRSNPSVEDIEDDVLPQIKQFTKYGDYETFLMNERQREFLFEGKRYYDLVRQARRIGNTNKYKSKLSTKYSKGGSAVGIKMNNLDFMYMPVLKSQIKLNPNLKQNPMYYDEEESVKN